MQNAFVRSSLEFLFSYAICVGFVSEECSSLLLVFLITMRCSMRIRNLMREVGSW